MIKGVLKLRFAFWCESSHLDPCDLCKKPCLFFFPFVCFKRGDNNEIKLSFGYVCTACASVNKKDLLVSLKIVKKSMMMILASWILDVHSKIIKDNNHFAAVYLFAAEFKRKTWLGKEAFLDKMGKEADLSCVVCSAKSKARCRACHVPRYCSEECQCAFWRKHKEECKKIQSMDLFSTL